MTYYTYSWFHIPTKTSGKRSEAFTSRERFLEHLVRWNNSAPGIWRYTEA